MEKLYKESTAQQKSKYEELSEKLDRLTVKLYTVEKENTKFKSDLQHQIPIAALQKQCQKTDFELQMAKLNTQLESELKKALSAQSENCKLREKIAEQQAQLESTAISNREMSQRINLLEEEILSLKVHARAIENTRPMTTKKNNNTPPQNQITQEVKSKLPHVIMIGKSNTKGVDTKRLSTKFTSEKHIAYSPWAGITPRAPPPPPLRLNPTTIFKSPHIYAIYEKTC